jgi:hypothetical protein
MSRSRDIEEVKSKLAGVAEMLEEMSFLLSNLSEDQVLWLHPNGKQWPIQRSVAHCVNCEHRAVTELQRALVGKPTPETVPADTAIFAWFAPTPYLLARTVRELRDQIADVAQCLDPSHLSIEAVRYPKHPPRKLRDYIEGIHEHTARHLKAVRRRSNVVPPGREWDEDVRAVYPDFGKGGKRARKQ